MLAGMLPEIDRRDALADERQDRRFDRGARSRERVDGAIVGVCRTAAAQASITSARRPSLTLGMHSMIAMEGNRSSWLKAHGS
jgi:hypothetical protein